MMKVSRIMWLIIINILFIIIYIYILFYHHICLFPVTIIYKSWTNFVFPRFRIYVSLLPPKYYQIYTLQFFPVIFTQILPTNPPIRPSIPAQLIYNLTILIFIYNKIYFGIYIYIVTNLKEGCFSLGKFT